MVSCFLSRFIKLGRIAYSVLVQRLQLSVIVKDVRYGTEIKSSLKVKTFDNFSSQTLCI